MSEFKDWIETELTHRLSPVKAPETLWAAIANPPERKRNPRLILWPALALVLLVASVQLLSQVGRDNLLIPSGHPGAVRIAGSPGVKIYRVGAATVLISAHPVPGDHPYSWTKGGQTYTLSSSDGTCLHCHANL